MALFSSSSNVIIYNASLFKSLFLLFSELLETVSCIEDFSYVHCVYASVAFNPVFGSNEISNTHRFGVVNHVLGAFNLVFVVDMCQWTKLLVELV